MAVGATRDGGRSACLNLEPDHLPVVTRQLQHLHTWIRIKMKTKLYIHIASIAYSKV